MMKCTFLNLYVASPALAGALSLACPGQAVAQASPQREAFFGQTHVHTSWSLDAYIIGNTLNGPEEAYKYATGEPIKHPAGQMVQITRPLDFQGVTDHSEYAGMMSLANDPTSPISKLPIAAKLRARTPAEVQAIFQFLAGSIAKGEPIKELTDPQIAGSVWTRNNAIADKYYKPGTFTTFCSYEWTSMPNNQNMHRNVFFKDCAKVPVAPFSAIDSDKAEDLWTWMNGQRRAGNEVLAISHNANLSNGLMFPIDVDGKGRPIDDAWAQERLLNEPLTELKQVKGASETHPELSPTDEFANFEIMNYLIGIDKSFGQTAWRYARRPTRMGSRCRMPAGYNPYKFGVVGAGDSHNSATPIRSRTSLAITAWSIPRRRRGFPARWHPEWTSFRPEPPAWPAYGPRKIRETSIFAAMQRKETFATSGVRIRVRLFGGWEYGQDLVSEGTGSRLPMRRACRWAAICRPRRARRPHSSSRPSRIPRTAISTASRSSRAGARTARLREDL